MADVSSTLRAWSATASSNSPSGGTVIGAGLDDNLRQIQAVIRQFLASQGTNMASSGTVDLSTADGSFINVTGTVATTSFGTEGAGIWYLLRASAAWPVTYNATSLIILPQRQSITFQAGDLALAISLGSGNWLLVPFTMSDGNFLIAATADNTKKIKFDASAITTATTRTISMPDANVALPPMTLLTNSLSGDVNLNNTANYFDGPSVAQGTAGTWFVSGTVLLTDATAGTNGFIAKLWDGTTIIASAELLVSGASTPRGSIHLSGYIASPAGNLRISARDQTTTAGVMKFNSSGNSKDSTISAIRIA